MIVGVSAVFLLNISAQKDTLWGIIILQLNIFDVRKQLSKCLSHTTSSRTWPIIRYFPAIFVILTRFTIHYNECLQNCDCLCKSQPNLHKNLFIILGQLIATLNSYPHAMFLVARLEWSALLGGGFTTL